jgi:hypothetical protein
MSWGAQNRSEDAKTPGVAGVRSDKPEPVSCPVQPYVLSPDTKRFFYEKNQRLVRFLCNHAHMIICKSS